MTRITIDQVREELEKNNWVLLSTEYQNLDSQIIVKCPEGHTVYTSWGKLRGRYECPACKQNKYKQNSPIIREKKKDENRILALDQASRLTGYSIIDGLELVHYGVFESTETEETARIHSLKMWLMSMLENWKPTIVGIEAIQYEENFGVTTFQTLARLQGVILDLCYELNIPCQVISSNTWRAYCGVKGRSRNDRKRSMQLLAKRWYDISVTDDEADALGLGKYLAETHQKKTEIVSWE